MSRSKIFCGYCAGHHAGLCDRAIEGVRRVNDILAEIDKMMNRPQSRPLTSNQMRQRANNLRDTAVGIKLVGGEVKADYDGNN